MKKGLILFFTFVCCLSLGFSAAEIALRTEAVTLTGFPEVTIAFSAWQASGLPISDLTTEDIALTENGGPGIHPDQVILNTDAPLAVSLVLDISGSMQGQPLEDAKVAAARFLDRLSAEDQAALIAFSHGVNTDPTVLLEGREMIFTQNLTLIYDLIEGLSAEGGTELYNAVEKAVAMTGALPGGHRAVLVLSDGVNEPATTGDPEAPIALAKENGIPVYVIGLGNLIDEPYLRQLASETGGYFRLTPKSSELAQTFDDMAALLKTQYTLVYTSGLAGGEQTVDLTMEISHQGAVVTEKMTIGPVPEIQMPEPTETLEPQPTERETEEVVLVNAITETPVVEEIAPELTFGQRVGQFIKTVPIWGWLLAVVVLIGLMTLLRKQKPVPEKCANCGFDLTGKEGDCPQCGSTRRLPKV